MKGHEFFIQGDHTFLTKDLPHSDYRNHENKGVKKDENHWNDNHFIYVVAPRELDALPGEESKHSDSHPYIKRVDHKITAE